MPKIIIYSTRTCVYCRMLKDYLTSRGISYKEILLDEQPEEIQASIDTCGSLGVPCSHIELEDGRTVNILGFNKPKLDEVLHLA